MEINAINSLAGQRAALEAPAEQSEQVYDEQVMEPLRPVWESFGRMGPGGGMDLSAPGAGLGVARTFGFYMPEHGVEEGLRALAMLEDAGSWQESVQALRDAEAALAPAEHGIDIPRVDFSFVLANPNLPNFLSGSAGYTGFGSIPGKVLIMAWPNDYNIPRLPSAVAHEFNHNVRLSFEPWSMATSVGQYIVLEGLAESFAAQLYGDDKVGPWALALTEEQAAAVRPRMADALEITGFNQIRGYIFGDWAATYAGYEPDGLPDYAGYTIGYQLVRSYLARTGKTAAEATYIPWREIVAESNYF